MKDRKNKRHSTTLTAAAAVAMGLMRAAMPQEGTFEDCRSLGPEVNSPFHDVAPSLTADGLVLVFASERPGGMGQFDLYIATRTEPNAPFDNIAALDELNTKFVDLMPNISPDGLKIYFTRTDDAFGASTWSEILLATRNSRNAAFTEPHVVQELRVADRIVFSSAVSGDNLTVVLHVEAGGQSADVYESTRESSDHPFPEPQPLIEINTPQNEGLPTITADGLALVFVGSGSTGLDLLMATRPTRRNADGTRAAFDTPRIIRGCVNTSTANEIAAFVTPDWPAKGSKLFFACCLPGLCGRGGDFDIFEATWRPMVSRFRRGDCNGEGVVNISDAVCILNWLFLDGVAPGCIAVTNTNGAAGVDISDATYLLNHLFLEGPALAAPYPDCGFGTLESDEDTCESPPRRCQP